jgi:hypothetical protein
MWVAKGCCDAVQAGESLTVVIFPARRVRDLLGDRRVASGPGGQVDFPELSQLAAQYALGFLGRDGAPLWPFTVVIPDGPSAGAGPEPVVTRFRGRALIEAVEQARASITINMPGVDQYAVVSDGYATTEAGRRDAVLIEVGGRGTANCLHYVQPYRVRRGLPGRPRRVEALGPQRYSGWGPSRIVLDKYVPSGTDGDRADRACASVGGLPLSPLPDPDPPAEAEDDLRAGAQAGDASAMNALGARLADRGALDEALRWFHAAAEHGEAAAMFNIALRAHLAGDLDAAARWYQRAVRAGDDDAMLNFGMLRAEQGELDDARRLWQAAAAQGNAAAMRNLAQLAASMGDSRAARTWQRKARAADPTHEYDPPHE